MDDAYWEEHARGADSNYNEEFAKYMSGLAVSLKCASVLEVGCNAGNDLKLMPDSMKVHGLDSNPAVLKVARARLPSADFREGASTAMPYGDDSIDMVFTHGFFNYLENEKIDGSVAEIFRVSAKYVVNCEMPGGQIDERAGRRGADMYSKWLDYKVRIISNVEMHEDIDPEKPTFVLARKL